MHFLFVELAKLNINVSFNLFCEKHGKNSRDQHFSVISNFLQQESMTRKLTSSQDICDAIEKHQLFSNVNNQRINTLQKNTTKNFKQIHTKAFVIPNYSFSEVTCSKLIVDGLKSYYNFFNDRFHTLKTHFMSDQLNFVVVENIKKTTQLLQIEKNPSSDKIKPVEVKTSNLTKKMQNWMIISRQNTNVINDSQISSDHDLSTTNIGTTSIKFNYIYCTQLKCSNCSQICKFRLSELGKLSSLLNQTQINCELKIHGHPKSRRKNKQNRTLNEAKLELKNHYIQYHFHKLQ